MLGVELGAAGQIGHLLRRERDRIGGEQPAGEAVGEALDLGRRRLAPDRRLERPRLGEQGGALRVGREARRCAG